MKFTWEDGHEHTFLVGKKVVGLHHNGIRPMTITLDSKDLEYFIGEENPQRYLGTLYLSLRKRKL